jgi:hypothetical protein
MNSAPAVQTASAQIPTHLSRGHIGATSIPGVKGQQRHWQTADRQIGRTPPLASGFLACQPGTSPADALELLAATLSAVLILVFPVWVLTLCVLLLVRTRHLPRDATRPRATT